MTKTKGNVIIEDIKIGDIHYEYSYGQEIKVKVLTLPVKNGDDFTWKSEDLATGKEIEYFVSSKFIHYGPNLYNYPAYRK